MEVNYEPKLATYTFFPPIPSTRTTADVFRLILFLPSGFSVERHVWHCFASGGAVRHETFGILPEVPVPKKVNSNVWVCFCWHLVGMSRGEDERIEGLDRI
jgi:hypothetical protein